MNYEIKNITGGILDIDDKSRRVKVAISEVDMKDFDDDVIDYKAYDVTIKQRGPLGKGLIWHLTDHNPSLKSAIARFKELYMEGKHLVGVSDVPNTTWGNDILELYKTGNINQHSIGFKTVKSEPVKNDSKFGDYTLIKEVMLFEGSAVLWGANPSTPTISVGKSLTKEEVKNEYIKTHEEINDLSKLLKKGRLSDDSFELIEIRYEQLMEKLQKLFVQATQPDVKSVEPVQDGLLDVFKTFNQDYLNQFEHDTGRIKEPTGCS